MRDNRAAFDRWAIVPRMLRDVSARALTVELLGRAAAGAAAARAGRRAASWCDADGDLRVARAAAARRACRTSSPTRAARRWRTAPRRWATPALVPAVLEHRRGARRQPRRAGRGDRLRGARRHPRHHDARLAAAGPRPRLAAVRAGPGHRAVHLRPAVPASSSRERVAARRRPRAAGGRRSTPAAVRRCSRSRRSLPGLASATTCARRCRGRRSRRSSTSTPTRRSAGTTSPRCATRTRLPVVLKGVLHPDDARRALDAGRRRRSSSPTTAAARSTARSRRSTRWSPSSPRPRTPPCCSTAASAPAPTSSRRSRSAPTRSCSAGRTSTGSRSPAPTAPGGGPNVVAELDLTLGLSGHTSVRTLDSDALKRL